MLNAEMKMFYGNLRTEQGTRHQQRDPQGNEWKKQETGGVLGARGITFI